MSECTVAADVGSHGGDGQGGISSLLHEGKLNEAAHVVLKKNGNEAKRKHPLCLSFSL